MRVFISSVIRDFEEFRDAAEVAIETLNHVPVRAEHFEASPDSPQQACLERVRDSDVLILILGERYGPPQSNGVSATHEEYNEAARIGIPVLVFLQADITPESKQARFIEGVQSWISGRLSASFKTADELERKVIRSLYSLNAKQARSPSDDHNALQHALARINVIDAVSLSQTHLVISSASSPTQSILRPSELENSELTEKIIDVATTGEFPFFQPSEALEAGFQGDALLLSTSQQSESYSHQPVPYTVPMSGARQLRRRRVRSDSLPPFDSEVTWQASRTDCCRSILVDEQGSVRITMSALRPSRTAGHQIQSFIEEDVQEDILMSLGLVERILQRIDSENRLTYIAIAGGLLGPSHHPWRTRQEQESSPYSATLTWRVTNDPILVHLNPPVRDRADLKGEISMDVAADLMVLLRRKMHGDNQI